MTFGASQRRLALIGVLVAVTLATAGCAGHEASHLGSPPASTTVDQTNAAVTPSAGSGSSGTPGTTGQGSSAAASAGSVDGELSSIDHDLQGVDIDLSGIDTTSNEGDVTP